MSNRKEPGQIKLNLSGVDPGVYSLFIGFFEGETPINIALEKECLLDKVTVESDACGLS